MKVLFLLSVAMLAFAADENTEQPKYEAVNKEVSSKYAHCKKFTVQESVVKGCSQCQPGYKLENNKCVLDETKCTYPSYKEKDGSDKCSHHPIGLDGKGGTCGDYSVQIVDANGQKAQTTIEGHSENTCLACVRFKGTSKTECEQCATGYLLNGGKCTPLSIKPFGEQEANKLTNDECFVGSYASDKTAQCSGCTGDSFLDNSLCKNTDLVNPGEGCIQKYVNPNNKLVCTKCAVGFTLNSGSCKKLNSQPELCITPNADGTACTKCLPGYIPVSDGCEQCKYRVWNSELKIQDECSILDTNNCGKCNPNCKLNSDGSYCVSQHCDMFNSDNSKCVRCEQGYYLYNGACTECTNDCFTSADRKTCVDGYYKATDSDGNHVCLKCEGKCRHCLNAETCSPDQIELTTSYSLNGKPCEDQNCFYCDETDQSICYVCRSTDYTLIGGRCYPKSESISVGFDNTYQICRYYEQPSFVTNKVENVQYHNEYTRQNELVYQKSSLAAGKDINEKEQYYCEYHPVLPYYYRKYNGELTCAGKNREITTDCECKKGYYPKSSAKDSDCEEFTASRFCDKPLNKDVCSKCQSGLVMTAYKDGNDYKFECGCPSGKRLNKYGVCIDCPAECATCRTIFKDNGEDEVQCLSCNGKAQGADIEIYIANNYYRDPSNQCKCQANTVAYEGDKGTVYACNPIPEGCNKQSTSYEAAQYTVNCIECNKEGFSIDSKCTTCKAEYYASKKTNDKVEECSTCASAINVDSGAKPYCRECEGGICTSCLDAFLDVSTSCSQCQQGYSLHISVSEDGTETPVCVRCPEICSATEGIDYCFLSKKDGMSLETFEERKNETRRFNSADFNSPEYDVYCESCLQEGTNPYEQCNCGDKSYKRTDGQCGNCQTALKDEKTKDDIPLGDLCKFENFVSNELVKEFGCENSTSTKDLRCGACRSVDRNPATNCTTCLDTSKYPYYNKETNTHECKGCNEICASCNDGSLCTSCKAKNAIGENCDKCREGYYKAGVNDKGMIDCQDCQDGCGNCTSKMTCEKCTKLHHIPNGEGGACYACETGYYLDITTDECIEVNKAIGVLESRPVCLDSTGAETDCTYQNHLDKKISQVIERPTKCDTSIYGVSADPVDGRCRCKTGYFDNRTKEEIDADPRPVCTQVQLLTEDDFCIDGKQIIQPDGNYTYECSKCNAEYLELNAQKKCVCKNTHYTTKWGMCVPCGRHNKGCAKCTGKTVCTECESGYTKQEVDKDTVICKAS